MTTSLSFYSKRFTPLAAMRQRAGRARRAPVPAGLRQAAHARTERSGVILLVVLGMLTLFSVLGVSYLVFTSRQRGTALNLNRIETQRIDTRKHVEDALVELLVGSNGPESSLWGHDLLGDLYGSRDAIEAVVEDPTLYEGRLPTDVADAPDCAPELLMGNQFLRFPTSLHREATYPGRRNDAQVERRYPGYPDPYSVNPPPTRFPIDDMLTGRLVTFLGGPLEGLTFPIVRYFGDHRFPAVPGRETLSGQVVIDIRSHLATTVAVDGISKPLGEWIADAVAGGLNDWEHRLFYDREVTNAHIDGTENIEPYGPIYINGQMLNGPGLGWDRQRSDVATATGPKFNLFEEVSATLNISQVRLAATTPAPFFGIGSDFETGGFDLPVAYQPHYGHHRLPPEFSPVSTEQFFVLDLPPGDTDEPYDAPDYNNLWLSYFPNDPELGEASPSFVRPALLNWLVNNPVPAGSLSTESPARLRTIIRAIQRATMRPIPLENDPLSRNQLAERGDGILKLRYTNFTGSNSHPGLSTPIDMSSTDPGYLAGRINDLLTALIGRDLDVDGIMEPNEYFYDVDNNDDGIVDSVWVDAGLPLTESSDGRLVKPLVAFMVEDLGGRVNVNLAGNLAQARDIIDTRIAGGVQHDNPVLWPARDGLGPVAPVPVAAPATDEFESNNLPTGFGYGPAEIDIRPLFVDSFAAATLPVRVRFGPQRLVAERLGIWETTATNSTRVLPTAILGANYIAAAGEQFDPLTRTGNDRFGAIRDPLRANRHDFSESQGIPTDTFGRMTIGLDLAGGIAIGGGFTGVSHAGSTLASQGPEPAGDAEDDPYEFHAEASTAPDAPYRVSELETLLRFDGFDRDLAASRLIELIDEYHSAPPATRAEQFQIQQLKRILAESITTHSNSVASATGVLPSEWRDSGDVVTDLASGTTTLAANAALAPQQVVTNISAPTDQERNATLWSLLPMELRSGQKLNLNRPFGNGVDDNGNGVIDEPQEVASGENGIDDDGDTLIDELDEREIQLRFDSITGAPTNSIWSSTRGDVTPGEPGLNSRAAFARDLYILAMVLTRDASGATVQEFDFPFDNTLPFTALIANPLTFAEEYRAWKIAQWAVNVADFRDPDAIMTRFAYDPNPFDGWLVTDVGGTSPTYRVVWGMEYPELALEESLAFHDRRVRDTAEEVPGGGGGQRRFSAGGNLEPPGSRDGDPDQYEIPKASLFLELRSTRSPQPVRPQANDMDDTANPMAFPTELYFNRGTAANPDWELDLGRLAPDNNPVWRVAITEYHEETVNGEICADFLLKPQGADGRVAPTDPPFAAGPALDRDTTTLDPSHPQFFGPTAATPPIDRIIWFANQDPDQMPAANPDGVLDYASPANIPADTRVPGQIYYNETTNRYLEPGQIAVIAPRWITPIGTAHYDSALAMAAIDADGEPQLPWPQFRSQQKIEIVRNNGTTIDNHINIYDLDPAMPVNKAAVFDSRFTAVSDASARPPLPIIASSNAPQAWTQDFKIGVNISAPYEDDEDGDGVFDRPYYNEPTQKLHSSFPDPDLAVVPPQSNGLTSWYEFDTDTGMGLPDAPLDTTTYAELERTKRPGTSGQETGTRPHFKTAYLQRLADPTQPYHPELNPYISIDYIALDLTVFNGSDDNTKNEIDGMGVTQWIDPNDENPYDSPPEERFASRYKTGMPVHIPMPGNQPTNLAHSVNTYPPELTTATHGAGPLPADAPAHFQVELNITEDPNVAAVPLDAQRTHSSTLGWPNQAYGQRWQQDATTPDGAITPMVGLPIGSITTANWLTSVSWLNRPFVSPDELMWVPTSAPGRLSLEFAPATADAGLPAGANRYDDANNLAIPPAANLQNRYDLNQRFTHLFNFYSSNDNNFDDPTNRSPNFWRILDWVEVPPPYDFDADFVSPETDISNGLTEDSAISPVFSYSTFFDPGGATPYINADPSTWTLASPGMAQDRSFFLSGQWGPDTPGSGRSNGFWTNHVSMEPFRPPFSFRSRLFRSGLINANTIKNKRVFKALMYGFSSDPERANNGVFWDGFTHSRAGFSRSPMPMRPHFDISKPTQFEGVFKPSNSSDIAPQIGGATPEPLASTRMRPSPTAPENPLFRRPASISVTQSMDRSVVHDQLGQTRLANVMTDQSNVYAVWITVGFFEVDAETMTVGRELGSDRGATERSKGFFIIDRSVPVMYRRGEQNNALDTVLLSRISE